IRQDYLLTRLKAVFKVIVEHYSPLVSVVLFRYGVCGVAVLDSINNTIDRWNLQCSARLKRIRRQAVGPFDRFRGYPEPSRQLVDTIACDGRIRTYFTA